MIYSEEFMASCSLSGIKKIHRVYMAIGRSQSPEASFKTLCVLALASACRIHHDLYHMSEECWNTTRFRTHPHSAYRESRAQARCASVIYFRALGRHLSNCNPAQGLECSKPKMKQSRQVIETKKNILASTVTSVPNTSPSLL